MSQIGPKNIVASGYDRVGERYSQQPGRSRALDRARYESALIEGLADGAEVLDLGCGNGIPTSRRLARRFVVTCVDISPRQIDRARQNVPDATFIRGDMTAVDFAPRSFDAVGAFFSIFHLPRQEHAGLFKSVGRWLRPGGAFAATMLAQAKEAAYARDWLGAPMYWSSYDMETSKEMIDAAGLRIINAQIALYDDDGLPGRFLWVVARKPRIASVADQDRRGRPEGQIRK